MYAVESRNNEVAKLLIKAGANANAVDKDRKTPLMHALEAKKRRFDNDLEKCVGTKGLRKLIRTYIDKEKEQDFIELVKASSGVNVGDAKGRTALMYAVEISIYVAHYLKIARRTKCEILSTYDEVANPLLKVLIETGADVNARDKYRRTALIYAEDSEKNFVRKLREIIPDKVRKKVDAADFIFMMKVAASFKSEVVEVLKKAGDSDAVDSGIDSHHSTVESGTDSDAVDRGTDSDAVESGARSDAVDRGTDSDAVESGTDSKIASKEYSKPGSRTGKKRVSRYPTQREIRNFRNRKFGRKFDRNEFPSNLRRRKSI